MDPPLFLVSLNLILADMRTLNCSFYYGDERLPDGDYVAGAISGSAHALRYWELSQDKQQHPWMDTFVAGVGYTKFEPPTTPRII